MNDDSSLDLWRYLYDEEFGTFGFFHLEGMKLWTVERPWLNNRRRVSCIPDGSYPCAPRRFHRGGYEAIEIQEVPDRSYIMFHIANSCDELAGCVAPGMGRGVHKGKWAVTNSTGAFRLLMKHYGGRRFTLHVRDLEAKP